MANSRSSTLRALHIRIVRQCHSRRDPVRPGPVPAFCAHGGRRGHWERRSTRHCGSGTRGLGHPPVHARAPAPLAGVEDRLAPPFDLATPANVIWRCVWPRVRAGQSRSLHLRPRKSFVRKLRQLCLRGIFVLSGTWWVNSGDDFDPKNAVPAPTGGFVKRTARTPLRRSANSMSTGPMPKIAMTTPTLRIDLGKESRTNDACRCAKV